jgi:hypothetical protein
MHLYFRIISVEGSLTCCSLLCANLVSLQLELLSHFIFHTEYRLIFFTLFLYLSSLFMKGI